MPAKPTLTTLTCVLLLGAGAAHAQPASADSAARRDCQVWSPREPLRNPTEGELRCQYGMQGPGRFGLLSYLDVPVYQSDTPMPGTHVVGVPGHARPRAGESYEQWEWRVLRTEFGSGVRVVHRALEMLDPMVAGRIMRFEQALRLAGIDFRRLETWRAPERQAFLFQQGRSRPGPLATTTLTSWHSQVDDRGNPAGRAVDYHVPGRHLHRFHEIAREAGLTTFGADSHDPGHVFLPDAGIPAAEIVLLRTLPRIPVVTLATGLPVDRPLPPGGLAAVRAAARQFAASPFIPLHTPRLAGRTLGPEAVVPLARPRGAAPQAERSPQQ